MIKSWMLELDDLDLNPDSSGKLWAHPHFVVYW